MHHFTASGRIVRSMRRLVLYLVLLGLAVVVVGISFAVLRYLHWSMLSWVVVVPIWITVLAVMIMVWRVMPKMSRK
jgi:CHASE2 domain-containing sensor protein